MTISRSIAQSPNLLPSSSPRPRGILSPTQRSSRSSQRRPRRRSSQAPRGRRRRMLPIRRRVVKVPASRGSESGKQTTLVLQEASLSLRVPPALERMAALSTSSRMARRAKRLSRTRVPDCSLSTSRLKRRSDGETSPCLCFRVQASTQIRSRQSSSTYLRTSLRSCRRSHSTCLLSMALSGSASCTLVTRRALLRRRP